ncbi:acyl-CoA dehydrogenase family protein [Actinomadura sp. WMMB 499]|uniref:acyl-CoA dehydrogenase family protein n=1 Tax=Actinomadura sp. WMMB 499 TaxID=1219491 RepID=UPI0012493D9D|nr:acyl-CoA dehydrogenase family protein [Actinomadura sp. WMMB 499]QFG21624.1 acyl-CoA dehydrogenase [Actinomadura sp. WMMB 499]
MTAPDTDASPIGYGEAALEFRDEIRDWLRRNAPEHLRGVPVPRVPAPDLKAHLDRWADTLTEAGLMCVAWPREYGGRGLSGVEVALMNEEFDRAGVPRLTRGMGEGLVGPAVIAHATEEQKRRILPPIISGEHDYCQGFSEPGAGSDLAGLRTRGEVDGTDLVINGQKTWTSGYYKANWMFCLVRTDPDAPKHRGISYVLLPLQVDGEPNGVEFRPIKRMTGQALFGESFLTDARTPLTNVIGGLHQGWRVAMTTLGSERGGSATTQHVAFERQFWRLVGEVRERGLQDDVRVREQLAWAWSQIQVIRANGLGLVADLAAGRSGQGLANGSTSKIRWSEFQRRLAEIAMDLIGPDALVTGTGYELGEWQDEFLATRSHTIWGGTAEVQRNIIAERVLGLPKETAR